MSEWNDFRNALTRDGQDGPWIVARNVAIAALLTLTLGAAAVFVQVAATPVAGESGAPLSRLGGEPA